MGCWHAPYTAKDAKVIAKAMEAPMLVADNDGKVTTPIDIIDYIGDDELADYIYDLKVGEDARPTILTFLQTWFGPRGDDEEIREAWGWGNPFEDAALKIFKELLTPYDATGKLPSANPLEGMTSKQKSKAFDKRVEKNDLSIPIDKFSRKALAALRKIVKAHKAGTYFNFDGAEYNDGGARMYVSMYGITPALFAEIMSEWELIIKPIAAKMVDWPIDSVQLCGAELFIDFRG